MTDVHMALSSKLGHFNLLEEIGQGWMGSVFRAFDPTLNRQVAIKVVREDLASDPRFVTDFLRETRVAARINHPHIVPIYFVGEDRGQYYIVMQLLKGRTLREVIEREGPLDEERALDLAIDVGEVLRAAYRSQLTHGNIKPANIFVTEEDGAKVLDFGLAKLANIAAPDGKAILGSPSYVSPDGVVRELKDFHTDVYSLGATLFDALSGRPPFDTAKLEELASGQLGENLALLRELRSGITPKTEHVVDTMLNSTLLCYRNYDMLLEDLRVAKTEATAKRLGISLQPQIHILDAGTAATPSHRRLIISLTSLVLAVLAGVAASVWIRSRPKPNSVPANTTTGDN